MDDELEIEEDVDWGDGGEDMDVEAALAEALSYRISPLKPAAPAAPHVADTELPDAEEGEVLGGCEPLVSSAAAPRGGMGDAAEDGELAAAVEGPAAAGGGAPREHGAGPRTTPLPGTPIEGDLRELLNRKRARDSSGDDADGAAADRAARGAGAGPSAAGRGRGRGRGAGRGGRGGRGQAAADPEIVAADTIARNIKEPKISLIRRIVKAFGVELCERLQLEAMEMHLEGVKTKSGERERTLGGIFLNLVSTNVPKKEFNQVLKEEKKHRKEYYEALRGEDGEAPQKRMRVGAVEGDGDPGAAEGGGEAQAVGDVRMKPRGGKSARRAEAKAAKAAAAAAAAAGGGCAAESAGQGQPQAGLSESSPGAAAAAGAAAPAFSPGGAAAAPFAAAPATAPEEGELEDGEQRHPQGDEDDEAFLDSREELVDYDDAELEALD